MFLHDGKRGGIKRLTTGVGGDIGRCQAKLGKVRREQLKPGGALCLANARWLVREEIDVIRRSANGSADGGERRIEFFRAVHGAGKRAERARTADGDGQRLVLRAEHWRLDERVAQAG